MLEGAGQCSVSTEALPAAPPCDLVFFSSILKTEVVLEDDETFLGPDMSEMLINSEHGTEKPVGFAICSGVRKRLAFALTADNLKILLESVCLVNVGIPTPTYPTQVQWIPWIV